MRTIEEINKDIMELRKAGISVNGISDGYHTIGDYKDMRNHWFISTLNSNPDISWKSKKHFDEKNDSISKFNGDFIAGIYTPEGLATQHLKLKYWDYLDVPELENAPKYDGYSEEEVKRRVLTIRPRKK
jgi:hypothetical protein